jgi:hypothetical protein
MITIAVLLAMIPLAAAHDLMSLAATQRARPAPHRNQIRATWGGFFFVLSVVAWVHIQPGRPYNLILLAAGAISLLYLVVGAFNSRGVPFDIMSVIWSAAGLCFFGWAFWRFLR